MDSRLKRIVDELKAARGIDLAGYRESTLQRRVAARMAKIGQTDACAYLERLRESPDECDRLIETITISVSSFFRDPMMYEVLAHDVLPEIIERKRAGGSKEIRVWSAGCAAGEEPYTLAILLDQALEPRKSDWTCLVFATDLDNAALDRARAGVYDRERLKHTKLGVLDTYFAPSGDGYELRPLVRKMVQFSWGDLVSSKHAIPAGSVFGSFDLVLCRNVLIYFIAAVQAAAFDQLDRSLGPGGYLVLGDSETLGGELEGKLQVVDRRNRIYRKPPPGDGAAHPAGKAT